MIENQGFHLFWEGNCPHLWLLLGFSEELERMNVLNFLNINLYDVVKKGMTPFFKISYPVDCEHMHIRYVLFVRNGNHLGEPEIYMLNTKTGAVAYSVDDYDNLFADPCSLNFQAQVCLGMPVARQTVIPMRANNDSTKFISENTMPLGFSVGGMEYGLHNSISLLNYIFPFQRYKSIFYEMDKAFLVKRSFVMKHFLDNAENVLKGIFQNKSCKSENDIFFVDSYSVFLETQFSSVHKLTVPAGAWVDMKRMVYGFDIAELYSCLFSCSYAQAISVLWSNLKDKMRKNDSKEICKIKYYKQEKFPTGVPAIDFIDFDPFLCERSYEKYLYKNQHGVVVVVCLRLRMDTEYCAIYYTLQSHHRTSFLKWFPVFPDTPLDVYNCNLISESIDEVVFKENEFAADLAMKFEDNPWVVYSACPGGLSRVVDVDFDNLKNKKVHICCVWGSIGLEKLKKLKQKMQTAGLKSLTFDVDDKFTARIDIDLVLKILQNPIGAIDESSVDGDEIIRSGVNFSGADRIREMLVDYLIESGTLVWIFAKHKVGKTWLGLSLAYAVSVGEKSIGPWMAREPKKVLYLNGDHWNHRLVERIRKIMRGFEKIEVPKVIPFSIYTMDKDMELYDSILDEGWRNNHDKDLMGFEFIVIDNYQSLLNNTMDVKKFYKWARRFTRQNISILVLDHTNSEGDLQGRIAKKRFADIGVKLEKDALGGLKVEYDFVREFDDQKLKPFVLKRISSEDSFAYELVSEVVDYLQEFDMISKSKIFAVALKKRNENLRLEEIGREIMKGKSSVGNYIGYYEKCVSILAVGEPQSVKNNKISLFVCAVDTLSKIPEDEFRQKLKAYQVEAQLRMGEEPTTN